MRKIKFGKYIFGFWSPPALQKDLHRFDLHLGGHLSSKGLIPEEDKHQYLISSIMEEAIASSQIEGAVTTRKKAKEMLRKNISPQSQSDQMIFNNYKTIQHILKIRDEDLSPDHLLEIHKLMVDKTLDDHADAGKFRTTNDIGVMDASDNELVYLPPDYREMKVLMRDLIDFFNEEKENDFIHPIMKASIIHFMIGYIHPFVDGNGRTARALFYWFLLKKEYWLTEYLSISRMIYNSKAQYANAYLYTEHDNNDLTYFITFQVKMLSQAFDELKKYIERKIKEKRKLSDLTRVPNINSRQASILKWVMDDPDDVFTSQELVNRFGVADQTVRNDLQKLIDIGLMERILVNRKQQNFIRSKNFERVLRALIKR
ncbi:MAG: Fic family protein [Bacteroidetes bacterium]|nr:Fic family protein [Bacteroidota bacterium]